MTGVTPGLRSLIGKLTAYKVHHWGSDSSAPSGVGREPAANLNDAQVISSLLKDQDPDTHPFADVLNQGKNPWDDDWKHEPQHQIVVDIDHPVHVVESSTPGHYHLYVELPGGIPQGLYFEWLQACAKIGLVEPGYVAASVNRGHTDLRLPWVSKADTPPTPEAGVFQPGGIPLPVQAPVDPF
jgi:hypothetical protein